MRRCSAPLPRVLVLAAALAGLGGAVGCGLPALGRQAPADAAVAAARLNNLGAGYMNQQRFEQALEQFEAALARDSALLVAQLNRGIALLHLQRLDEAREALVAVTGQAPDEVRAWYNVGLLERSLGNAEAALAAFDRAATLDPLDADTHYLRGAMLAQLQRHQDAIAPLLTALELNPFHASAEFALARAHQRLDRADEAQSHLRRFQRLVQEGLAAPMGAAYGDQGPYSLAEPAPAAVQQPAAIPVRFTDVTGEAGLVLEPPGPEDDRSRPEGREEGRHDAQERHPPGNLLGPGACAFDAGNDGLPDLLLLTGRPDRPLALFVSVAPGRFEDRTAASGLDAVRGAAIACAAGDYDNDGRIDLAVSLEGRVVLLRQTEEGRFEDVTEAAGIAVGGLPVGLTFVDYDHDGDLDLFVARFPAPAGDGWPFDVRADAGAPSAVLLRNNGNGTFTDVSVESGFDAAAGALGAVLTDANNDRAVDLVVTGASPALFVNPREGAFTPTRPWAALPSSRSLPSPLSGAPTAGVVVFDFDKDGWMDVAFTHWAAPGLTLWRNVDGRAFEQVALPETGWTRGWGLAACDYDNDGWIDLVAVGEGGPGAIRVLRNAGEEGFVDRTAAAGLADVALEAPRALLCFDADGDGGADLLITQHGAAPRLLRNEGGDRHRWLRVALTGLNDNRSAIGTKVEVFAGPLWQKWEVQGASGYLGQAPLALVAGLGEETEAEILRLLWPTGVVQDEVQLASNRRHAVDQIDRRGSSCPVLFTWNGSRFEFVADAIGPGILGHWVAPGQRNIPDPTEYIKIEGRQLQPKDGLLSIRFVEPMEEVVYLDEARLVAVDHPADVEINPNEYFASAPPFPEFRIFASRDLRLPISAWDGAGHDVMAALREHDRRYVQGFGDLPFKGFAELHALDLDLGPAPPGAPTRLIMRGLTDYFTANSIFAAWQAGIQPVVPYVEALVDGRWVRIADDIGFPAGLARTMVADLTDRMPAGARRIRIWTNLKIYWDQILVDRTIDEPAIRQTEIPLVRAELAFRGFPREIPGEPAADLTYDYDEVSATGPFARQVGHYTRYGDVAGLLAARDDRFAVMGAGDEIALEFDAAALPPLPHGWRRTYLFYADGFAKDMDYYAAAGETVGPLPFHAMPGYPYPPDQERPLDPAYFDYLLNTNIRAVSGREAGRYRFEWQGIPPGATTVR